MRAYRHWTPRYAVDRLAWSIYQRRNAEKPWLTPAAISMLDTMLRPTDDGIEWGSGRSTVWFARRLHHLTSVEDDPRWYERVKQKLAAERVQNASYRLLSSDEEHSASDSPYVRACDAFADGSLGFALVDGSAREHCALAVLSKLSPGAILAIDNINWFLDHPTRSPSSRYRLGPKNERWAEFTARVANWRMAWTSSGVTDTAIWIKPPGSS